MNRPQPVMEVTTQPVGSFQVMKVTPTETLKETFSKEMESIVRTSFSGHLAFALWLAHYGMQRAAASRRDGVYWATKNSCYHRYVWQTIVRHYRPVNKLQTIMTGIRQISYVYVCPRWRTGKWSDWGPEKMVLWRGGVTEFYGICWS